MAKNGFRASRGIKRRFIVEAMLELTSPTHLGGSDPYDMLDMPITRDATTGKPILYGTTLAGLLRGVLSDRLSGHGKEDSVFTFSEEVKTTKTTASKALLSWMTPLLKKETAQ